MLKQSLNLDEAIRKLASIQEIKEINPIENADAIEVATILGWQVVVRKDAFKSGDKIVYFEIDSFLPMSDTYAFVGKERINPITLNTPDEEIGYRLSTAVLRGQVSQGLVMKFNELDPSTTDMSQSDLITTLNNSPIGTDVTKLLGVTKFDRPEIANELGNIIGLYPSQYIPKTDEERIQNEPESYHVIKGQPYYISSKIDGTSITTIWNDSELICATRNNRLDTSNQIEKMLDKKGILNKLSHNSDNITLQSELYGIGIMKNPLGIQDKRLATFTIHKNDTILGLEDMLDVVSELDLEIPEIVEIGSDNPEQLKRILDKIESINKSRENINPVESTKSPLKIIVQKIVSSNFNYTIAEIIERMNGTVYSTSGKFEEGGVIRPLSNTPGMFTTSFKVINNKFLIKAK